MRELLAQSGFFPYAPTLALSGPPDPIGVSMLPREIFPDCAIGSRFRANRCLHPGLYGDLVVKR